MKQTNRFRKVKGGVWMRRELNRLESLRPVAGGDARKQLEQTITEARERLDELTKGQ